MALLAGRDFRLMLATAALLDLGYFLRIAAQSWLAFELTDQQLWVGLANAVRVIPIFALSLFGGVVTDRFDRRYILLTVRGGLAAVVFITAWLVVTDAIAPWHLIVLSMAIGAIVSFGSPAYYAIMYDLAGRARLWVANSMAAVVSNAGAIAGPVMAGAVMAASGAGPVYFFASGLYLSGAAGVLLIRTGRPVAGEKKGPVLGELAAGLRYVRANPQIAWALAVTGAAFAHSAIHPLLPFYARDVLGRGAGGYGFLAGAFGAGLFAGSLLPTVLPDVKRKGLAVLAVTLTWDAAMALFGFSRIFEVSLVLMFMIGFAGAYMGNALVTILQTMSSDEMRGRVMSIYAITAEFGTLGWLAGGALARAIGNDQALWAGAAAGTAVTLSAFAMSPALRRA
jgi:MFS family permease